MARMVWKQVEATVPLSLHGSKYKGADLHCVGI